MEPNEVLEMARFATIKVLNTYAISVCHEDFDDLKMAAATAILVAFEKKPSNNAYAWRAAMNEVLKCLLREIYGRNPKTLDEDFSDISDLVEVDELEPRSGLPEDLKQELFEMLLNTRSKKGARGAAAAQRDIQILDLIFKGFNNTGISQKLGIPVGHVKKYRHELRVRLRSILG